MSKPIEKRIPAPPAATGDYPGLVGGISELVEAARRGSARTVNAFMTATYWEVGRRIVEFEQGGERRVEYGEALLERLSQDLASRYGRGFARPNLIRFRQFYQTFPTPSIRSTPSNISQPPPDQSVQPPVALADLARALPLIDELNATLAA